MVIETGKHQEIYYIGAGCGLMGGTGIETGTFSSVVGQGIG